MRRRWLSMGLLVHAVIAVACIAVVLLELPQFAHTARQRAILLRQLNDAERRWNERGITSYQVVVVEVQSIFHAQWNTVVVRDGQVTEQSGRCIRAPAEVGECKVEPFDPAEYTVPSLFATAREMIERTSPPTEIRLVFDEMYGYLDAISQNTPGVIHGEYSLGIESLTPL